MSKSLWDNFKNTGKINDYLAYKKGVKACRLKPKD